MLTDKDDLAFVVGVNNSVLVVQDFTADHALTEHAIDQLAPGGGTALWDAVDSPLKNWRTRRNSTRGAHARGDQRRRR